MLERVHGGRGARLEIELGKDVAQVAGHRLLADMQLLCDAAIGIAGRHAPQHLEFTVGERARVNACLNIGRILQTGIPAERSTAAPSCSNAVCAAVSSMIAFSSSPNLRQARATCHRVRAQPHTAPAVHPRGSTIDAAGSARPAPPRRQAEPDPPLQRHRTQKRKRDAGRDLRQFVTRAAARLRIAGGQRNFYKGVENHCATRRLLRVFSSIRRMPASRPHSAAPGATAPAQVRIPNATGSPAHRLAQHQRNCPASAESRRVGRTRLKGPDAAWARERNWQARCASSSASVTRRRVAALLPGGQGTARDRAPCRAGSRTTS